MEEMTAFVPGKHVLVDLDDESMVAGYLMNYLDDGWVLNVTHKEFPVVYAVPAETSESIREQLRGKSSAHLRVAAVLSGSVLGVVAKKEDVVEFLAGIFEAKMLAGYTAGTQLRELKSPITKFFNHDIIRTMELTADRNMQEELQSFDPDVAIDEILKSAEKPITEGEEEHGAG